MFTFGYDAYVASIEGGVSQSRVADHARNLLVELSGLRDEEEIVRPPNPSQQSHSKLRRTIVLSSLCATAWVVWSAPMFVRINPGHSVAVVDAA